VAADDKALLNLFRHRRYTIVHAHISAMNLFPLLAAEGGHPCPHLP